MLALYDLTNGQESGSFIMPEPSRAEPSRAEPSRAEPSRAEPSRAEPSRAEPSRAEPSRASSCACAAADATSRARLTRRGWGSHPSTGSAHALIPGACPEGTGAHLSHLPHVSVPPAPRSWSTVVRSLSATFSLLLGLALSLSGGSAAAEGTLPTVSVSDAEAYEDDRRMNFEVSLSRPSSEQVTVELATSSGTATSGTDFQASSWTVTFGPNWTGPYRVSLSVYDDQEIEPDETFTVTLTNPVGATLGDATATGTIRNDDTTATLTASEIEDSTATLTIGGHTDGWSYKGTGSWYQEGGIGRSVHPCTAVAAGTSAVSIDGLTAAARYNYWAYSDSSCSTRLAKVRFSTLASEGTPTVSVSDAQHLEGSSTSEGGIDGNTWMVFLVSLSQPSRERVMVELSTSGGTAISGTDFTAVSQTLTFPANRREPQYVPVLVHEDLEPEPDETFTVTLTNPMGATLGDATATGTIKDDGDTTLTASDIKVTTATLTIGDDTDDWSFKGKALPSGKAHPCTAVAAGTAAVSISGLTAAKKYEYGAYSGSTCRKKVASVEFGTLAPEGAPTVNVSDAQMSEGGAWMTFWVSLSAPSREQVTVDVRTSDGTAASGTDFRAVSRTLTFPANSGDPLPVRVLVYDDQESGPDETFTVTLANPTGATLGDATATGTIKDDDTAQDTTPPGLVSARATSMYFGKVGEGGSFGWGLTLTYNEPLDNVSIPGTDDFVVKVDGSPITVGGVRIEPRFGYVLLDMPSQDLWKDQAVTLSYTPGSNPIQDTTGNDAPTLIDLAVIVDEGLSPRPSTVQPPSGRRPVADAGGVEQVAGTGGVQIVGAGASVTLDGSGSSDPDGDSLTFAWAQEPLHGEIKGPGGEVLDKGGRVFLTGAHTARATFVAPTQPGVLYFVLTVSDSSGRADGDSVLVEVRDLETSDAPEFGAELVAAITLTAGQAMDPVVLPEATGGNGELTYALTSKPAGPPSIPSPVSASPPPGLSFDPATRTLSGTPTTNGTWSVAYTAVDADDNTGDSDTALQVFTIEVQDDPLAPPAATGVAVTSSPADGDTYELGETIRVTLTFDKAVTVDTSGGTPHLTIDMDPAEWGAKQAAYESGSGTTTLTFAHEVVEPNISTQGIAVLENTLALRGGTIRSASGKDADLSHDGLAHDPAHKVDWALPSPSTPAFEDGERVTLSIDENHADGAVVGTVAATDEDGDAPAYSLTGEDAAPFEIDEDGTISVKSGTTLDFEARASYAFTAEVTDGEDADGNPEQTPSADDTIAVTVEVGNVEEPPSAPAEQDAVLTASFHGMPAEHDGSAAFSFELRFSEDFGGRLPYKMLRDEALQATNGKVTGAKRVAQNQNQRWTITVQPRDRGDLTVSLAATTDCGASGAICTPDGRALSNSPSATVAGPRLTAEFRRVPAEHDGSTFVFRVRFSEDADVTPRVLREDAFDVSGGTVQRAPRVNGRDDLREIHVQPSGHGPVSIALPATADCAATGAICTADGRELSNTNSATVAGPPALSVADARVREGPDAALAFAVRLDRAASGAVTVDYATADGTATAGEDYTATSGTLTFAAGEREKTVSVTVLDDAHDEGEETFDLTLSNASGAYIAANAATATGTIENADPLPKAWLSRFGRTSAVHVVDILDSRFDAAAPTSDRLTLGGRPVDMAALRTDDGRQEAIRGQSHRTPDPAFDPDNGQVSLTPSIPGGQGVADGDSLSHWMPEQVRHDGELAGQMAPAGDSADATALERALWQALTHPGSLGVDKRFLSQSSFHLSLTDALRGDEPDTESIETARAAPDRPGHWSLWGQGALTRFQGMDDGVNLDGEVLTGLLGLDYAKDRWLAGVALAWHDGDGGYQAPESGTGGDLDSSLVTVNPYLRYALTPRLSVWGTLGYGTGTMQLRPESEATGPQDALETDLSLSMGAMGVKGIVLSTAATELALKSDALWVRTASKETDGLQGATADTRRLRLLLSGQHRRTLANDALLSPSFELGLRYDDGDAETGFGMELGGGLRYADAVRGLTVETRARALIAHEDGGYEEWGLGGSLSLDPGRLGRGLALRLDSGWGIAQSNAEALWQRQTTAGISPQHNPAAQARFNAELGYGLDVPWTYAILTPYGGMEWAGSRRALKLGWRFDLGQRLNLSFEGERMESGYERADHSLMLRTTLPW